MAEKKSCFDILLTEKATREENNFFAFSSKFKNLLILASIFF
jgi:hypothetical protein